ncbi:MAG TPA: hypothetical protein VF054_14880 [Micromonosporaceae bacterium]
MSARVSLDPVDPSRVARTCRAWLQRGWEDLLVELSTAVAAREPGVKATVTACRTERDPLRGTRYTPARFASTLDLIGERPLVAQVDVYTEESHRAYGCATLTATRVVDDNAWVRLEIAADLGDAFDPDTGYDRWVDFMTEVLSDADPAYGEITTVRGDGLNTELDLALRRLDRDSIEQSRRVLRGYAWVTVVPQELVERLGGVAAIEGTGAVTQVRPLASGGVLLRATPSPEEYDDAAMDRLFRLLAPVLPVGEPRTLPGWPTRHQVVYVDAATVVDR